jgi:hypothetical protein
MVPKKIVTEDPTVVEQVQQVGELSVEVNGVRMVLMTLDARQGLHKIVYDDGEWTEGEMLAVTAEQLDDPEGWGAPSMEVYDNKYGDTPTDDGEDQ